MTRSRVRGCGRRLSRTGPYQHTRDAPEWLGFRVGLDVFGLGRFLCAELLEAFVLREMDTDTDGRTKLRWSKRKLVRDRGSQYLSCAVSPSSPSTPLCTLAASLMID